MNNNYHRYLNIPVEFKPVFPTDTNFIDQMHGPSKHIGRYDMSMVNNEFKEWLATLNLNIRYSEIFHLVPGKYVEHAIHIDGTEFDRHVKLNFVYCDSPSYMNWYTLKKRKSLSSRLTPAGTNFLSAHDDDVDLVYSVQVGKPSLVNVGVLHNISTGIQTPRCCFSFLIGYIDSNSIVTWDNAIEIFKDYIIGV
jgi:hypothetical protein